jgi:LysM repeat protein
VLYRVVAGDSLQQIAATVGLTVDQVLAQAHVISASEIQVGTLLDLRVPAKGIRD